MKSLQNKANHFDNVSKNAERAAVEAEDKFQVFDSFSSAEGRKRLFSKEKYAPINQVDVSSY